MKFIFNADNSTEVTAFTDRPDRLTDRLTMKKFANSFDTILTDGKPNASLTHWDMKGEFNNHVHETLKINSKGNKYTIKASLLADGCIDQVVSDSDNNNSNGGANAICIPNPFLIAQANFFIGSAPWYCFGFALIAPVYQAAGGG